MFERTHLWNHQALCFNFLRIFFITFSISVHVVSLFIISISSWFNLGDWAFLRIYPILLGCPFFWHIVAHNSFLWSFVFLYFCCNLFFLLPNIVDLILPFFSWCICLIVCQFCLSPQRSSFISLYCCSSLLFHLFLLWPLAFLSFY